MKAGDLCKVISKNTHTQCQYGQYVIILKPLNPLKMEMFAPKWFETINQTTGKWHHHHKDDLEVISEER